MDDHGFSRIIKGPTINRKWSIWRLLWKIHLERCAVRYWTFRCHSLSFMGNSKRIFQSKFWLDVLLTNVSFPSISEISRRTARRMEKMLQGSHLWYEWQRTRIRRFEKNGFWKIQSIRSFSLDPRTHGQNW